MQSRCTLSCGFEWRAFLFCVWILCYTLSHFTKFSFNSCTVGFVISASDKTWDFFRLVLYYGSVLFCTLPSHAKLKLLSQLCTPFYMPWSWWNTSLDQVWHAFGNASTTLPDPTPGTPTSAPRLGMFVLLQNPNLSSNQTNFSFRDLLFSPSFLIRSHRTRKEMSTHYKSIYTKGKQKEK